MLSLVLADVQFVTPEAGAVLDAGGSAQITIDVEWEDSGISPSLDDLDTYQIFLCGGGNGPTDRVRCSCNCGLRMTPTDLIHSSKYP